MWNNAVVTNSGNALYAQALTGTGITITAAKGGSTTVAAELLMTQTDVTAPKKVLPISGSAVASNVLNVNLRITNVGVTTGYTLKMIGIYGKTASGSETLIAILEDSTGEYIPSTSENAEYVLEVNVCLPFSSAASIAVSKNLDSLATLEDLSTHTGNASNPHGVTKTQVGLGNVPNVATNDQTPTYTAASVNTALVSGEKISVAFGKIAKAVSSLISHLANKSNPHGVTKAQVGLGNADNTADADKPISTAQAAVNALKANAADLTAHTGNSTAHVTAAERLSWNGKAEGSEADGGAAAEAVKLKTARKIGNASFDGSADIGISDILTGETSGNPLTIEGLQGGVPFNAIKISGSGETSIVGRTLTLNRCGKNLLDMTGRDRTASGVTTTIANGIVTMTGTATAGTTTTTGGIYFDVSKFPIGTVLTFSQRVISTGINTTNGKRKTPFYLEYRNASNAIANINNYTSAIIYRNEDNTIAIGKFTVTQETIDAGIVSLYPQGFTEAGYVYDNHILSVQLELGNSATDYEPYSGTTYTITPDANPYTVTADVRQLDGVNNLWITDESSPTLTVSYCVGENKPLKKVYSSFDGTKSLSNPNLIDNSFFNVNQRGENSYSGMVYGLDRWVGNSAGTVVSVQSGYVSVTYKIAQIIESGTALFGKTVTLSVMTSDGIIYSKTATVASSWSSVEFAFGSNGTAFLFSGSDGSNLRICVGSTTSTAINIAAVKLEIGSVSTLANDVLLNPAIELIKCQRYYEKMAEFYTCANAEGYADIFIPFKVTKRITPTAIVKSANAVANKISYYTGSSWIDVDAIVSTTEDGIRVIGISESMVNHIILFSWIVSADM